MPEDTPPPPHNRRLRTHPEALDELDRLAALIDQHEQKHQYRYGHHALDQRLAAVISMYERSALQTLAGVKQFRDDMLVWCRAMSMVLSMVGNAETHREKDARLRGAIELLETNIRDLRAQEFDFNLHHRGFPDIFRSNLPMREYVERIHALEAEVKEWQDNFGREEAKS